MEVTRQEKAIQHAILKAWDDANFKKELINNPVSAIEGLTGESLAIPEGKTLVVVDETDESKVYLKLPPKPSAEDMELSEEQLEVIAGGNFISTWIEVAYVTAKTLLENMNKSPTIDIDIEL